MDQITITLTPNNASEGEKWADHHTFDVTVDSVTLIGHNVKRYGVLVGSAKSPMTIETGYDLGIAKGRRYRLNVEVLREAADPAVRHQLVGDQ